jgi:hypothetical protein
MELRTNVYRVVLTAFAEVRNIDRIRRNRDNVGGISRE